jgi:integrase
MAEKLTETAVSRARAPKTGQVFLWDSQVTGFGVRILLGGSKTFWFQYRPFGGGRSVSSRMVRIGSYPAISVADARKAARVFAGEIARGIDPAAKRQAERTRSTTTLLTLLAEDGAYQRDLERRRIVNARVAMSSLRRGLARLMSKEVSHLTRADLVAAINAIEDDGRPGAADDLRKFTRVFLEWCVGSGRITANPLAGLRQPKRSRAERLQAAANGGRALSDDEIRKLWQAAIGALIRLALLTGLRRGELAQIERARDILADRIVVQPEHAKSGAKHAVPLTDLMRQVIAGEPITTSPLLFPSAVTGGRNQRLGALGRQGATGQRRQLPSARSAPHRAHPHEPSARRRGHRRTRHRPRPRRPGRSVQQGRCVGGPPRCLQQGERPRRDPHRRPRRRRGDSAARVSCR